MNRYTIVVDTETDRLVIRNLSVEKVIEKRMWCALFAWRLLVRPEPAK